MVKMARPASRVRGLVLVCLASGIWHPPPAYGQKDVPHAIAEFEKADAGMRRLFAEAYGYAIFPSVGKGAIGIGGARGKGWVYERRRLRGRQAYREVIFFKDETALNDFCRGNFELSAQATAVAVTAGASANVKYNGGVAIFTMAKGGLMFEASVGGQKFSFQPLK
jgi:lipid-binding SYLF domain-containing protein